MVMHFTVAMTLGPIDDYQQLLGQIARVYSQGNTRAVQAVNTQLLETYWQIGQYIVEFEQGGAARSDYGQQLLKTLSQDLKASLGRGFSRSNLVYMRLLYLRYPIGQKPSDQLSWSHYVELLKIEDDLERNFYEKQAINEHWSVPELKRQKGTALFLQCGVMNIPRL
ncbi:MAG: DUF1016 N-terminal domain-containing protein [Cyanobacteria bacterium P01_C01_bin.118]